MIIVWVLCGIAVAEILFVVFGVGVPILKEKGKKNEQR